MSGLPFMRDLKSALRKRKKRKEKRASEVSCGTQNPNTAHVNTSNANVWATENPILQNNLTDQLPRSTCGTNDLLLSGRTPFSPFGRFFCHTPSPGRTRHSVAVVAVDDSLASFVGLTTAKISLRVLEKHRPLPL
jgi:hypothetical protein